MELYPRIGASFDLKTWTNCRMGMMGWAVIILCYAVKQLEATGAVADSMLVSVALMQIYIAKFFLCVPPPSRRCFVGPGLCGHASVAHMSTRLLHLLGLTRAREVRSPALHLEPAGNPGFPGGFGSALRRMPSPELELDTAQSRSPRGVLAA